MTKAVGLSCTETLIALQDDLGGSGVEESCGTAVSVSADPTLYDAIAAAALWPVAAGHRLRQISLAVQGAGRALENEEGTDD